MGITNKKWFKDFLGNQITSTEKSLARKKKLQDNELTDDEKAALLAEIEAKEAELEELKKQLEEVDKMEDIEVAALVEEVAAAVANDQTTDNNAKLLTLLKPLTDGTPKQTKSLKEAINKFLTQLNVVNTRVKIDNAFTVTGKPGVAEISNVLLPSVPQPNLAQYWTEAVGTLNEGKNKLQINVFERVNTGGVVAVGGVKPSGSLTMNSVDLEPIKVASTILDIPDEYFRDLPWLEQVIMNVIANEININIDKALVNLLSTTNTPFAVVAGVNTKVAPTGYDLAKAGAAQMRSLGQYAPVILVQVNQTTADFLFGVTDTTGQYISKPEGWDSQFQVVVDEAIPSNVAYISAKEVLLYKDYQELYLEKAISHKHDTDGERQYTNSRDLIGDRRAFGYIARATGNIYVADVAAAIDLLKS